ncbi:MAG: neutral/alkaline non-lysosomal ceramidase N-terminal domain-containing protein [Verrucomicrobia bacterium]|nr:neutral/alkaline non-lysosomal ceramidase N-terminal domain-containing protein [Verrucomicrobiota bacterium]
MNTARFISLLTVGLALCANQGFAATVETNYLWKAGVASAVITPQTNMWMSGYAARKSPSHGTAQDLFAKALALEDEKGKRLVIVTMDIIGVRPWLRQLVEKHAAERHKLPPECLVMNASHTHCGPEYREIKEGEKTAGHYTAFLQERLARIVDEAISKLAPARLSQAHARCGFAMNRRLNYALPKTDPNSKRAPNPDGPVDHNVPVLMVQSPGTNLCAVLFSYACHNTTLSSTSMTNNVPRYEFNGDYAGFAQETLQAGRPGLTAMFMEGCGADQNPYPRHYMIPYVKPLEFAQQHGRTLAFAVEAAMAAHVRPVRGPIRGALEYVTLEREQKDPKKPVPSRNYPVQVIRLGDDLTMVTLGAEVVVDYSLRLKRELAGKAVVWVAGYSNDYGGYIPSLRVLKEGGYEAPDYKPDIEERIVGKVRELHERLNR